MDYLITILISIVSGVLVFILQSVIRENRELKRKKDECVANRDKALEDGMVCLLRKNLMDEHEIWTDKGYITSHALENGLAMYKAYKALGGNGMIDHMEEEVKALPIKD
jgi:hypothetical protein